MSSGVILLLAIQLSLRADHATEVQSLRMAQSHPNVVKIHELHEDEVFYFIIRTDFKS